MFSHLSEIDGDFLKMLTLVRAVGVGTLLRHKNTNMYHNKSKQFSSSESHKCQDNLHSWMNHIVSQLCLFILCNTLCLTTAL